uniref:Uncharacterized protein n=1 Tax=Picea glauca TaxID=3330 RepID=A0A117NFE0_PICGL|nr:hypothetical protein ABT39_MTgene4084 [Picea glauca]KUM45334.1 hypothetical protein ABT39_MTgene3407 [Picea glauca]
MRHVDMLVVRVIVHLTQGTTSVCPLSRDPSRVSKPSQVSPAAIQKPESSALSLSPCKLAIEMQVSRIYVSPSLKRRDAISLFGLFPLVDSQWEHLGVNPIGIGLAPNSKYIGHPAF